MTLPESMRRGLYFEEIEPGRHFTSPGRTVTEADIVAFAGQSGDFNLIHTDAAYAEQGPFGKRVAHGLLVLSIASGLATRTGFMEGTVLAWRDIEEWKFTRPVFIGDTVHVDVRVLDTKPMPRLGGGMVQLEMRVLNQQDEVVQRGRWGILVQNRPA
jgi:acyl dehydratase